MTSILEMLRYFQYTGLLFNDVETCSVVHRLPDKAIRMILGCKIDPFNLLIFSIFLKCGL